MPSLTNHRQSTILTENGGSFTMPGNFKVIVQVLNKQEAKDDMDVYSLAQYWQEEHVICLRKSRSSKKRKADLEHELQHMVVDWVDHYMRKAKCRISKK